MPTLTVTCRRCGHIFKPAPDAFRASTWHTCPACLAKPHPPAAERTDAA